MSDIDEAYINAQVKLLFESLETARATTNMLADTTQQPTDTMSQIVMSEKQNTIKYFSNVIDQPSFMTNDHIRMRDFLIDWYASNKSLITKARHAGDVFSLPATDLNELLLSFGFPYPKRLVGATNKALFLLDLINLYQKKGTPETFAKSLKYFGLSNVYISEWWLKRNVLAEGGPEIFFESSRIYPKKTYLSADGLRVDYTTFIQNDPYWQIDYPEMQSLLETNKISLPSITPHIGIEAEVSLTYMNIVFSILNKKMKEMYDYWQNNYTLPQNLYDASTTETVSLLEICLGVIYAFDSQCVNDTSDVRIREYQDDIDTDGDLTNDLDYQDDIIKPYLQLVKPPFVEQNPSLLNPLSLKKRMEACRNIYTNDYTTTTQLVSSVDEAFELLQTINPTFATKLYNCCSVDRADCLDSLLSALDGYVSDYIESSNVSLKFFFIGDDIYDKLRPIMDFFKPFRARILTPLLSFVIKNPLMFTQLEDDSLSILIRQVFRDDVSILSDIYYKLLHHINDNISTTDLCTDTVDLCKLNHTVISSDALAHIDSTFSFLDIGKRYNKYNDVSFVDDYINSAVCMVIDESKYRVSRTIYAIISFQSDHHMCDYVNHLLFAHMYINGTHTDHIECMGNLYNTLRLVDYDLVTHNCFDIYKYMVTDNLYTSIGIYDAIDKKIKQILVTNGKFNDSQVDNTVVRDTWANIRVDNIWANHGDIVTEGQIIDNQSIQIHDSIGSYDDIMISDNVEIQIL